MSQGAPDPPAFVSVVVTVRDEARNLRALLDSLLVQERPFEVVLVDALSQDGTVDVARQFDREHPGLLTILERYGSRGVGRNTGARAARGEWIAFIDGDCVAESGWLAALRRGFAGSEVVAGHTTVIGRDSYGGMERVELYLEGSDVTYPSCNLGYRRRLFERLDGFDPRFITAEDIDLNLRAVRLGAHIEYRPDAVVGHRVRPTLLRFLVQAFWNGYGRKQLTEKHGSLWGNYRVRRLLSGQRSVLAWIRLAAAFAGYFTRVLTGGDRRLSPGTPPSDRSGPTTFRSQNGASEPRSA